MDRRHFLASLASMTGLFQSQNRAVPNFVFILADDLGISDLSPEGNAFHDTPATGKLAAEGARFTNAYAACPVCSPTRAAILTGKYPARLKVTDWIPGRPQWPTARIVTPPNKLQLGLEEITLAEALKPLGYKSAHIGKWHLGGNGYTPEKQGFDLSMGGDHRGSLGSYFGPFNLPGILPGTKDDEITERLTAAACDFVAKQKQGQPFFLNLAHYTVHTPMNARAAIIEKYKERNKGQEFPEPTYAAMVESLDNSIAAVRKALSDSGLTRDTVIILTSDNGGLRYEGSSNHLITTNAPYRAGKGHLYEGGIREPLYMAWPGVIPPGLIIDTPVSSIDFFPTLLAMASAKPTHPVDGISLTPLLGGEGPLASRDALFWHYPHYSNQGGVPGSAVRIDDWKLIEFYEESRLELFNLKSDPGETTNLVKRNPEKARELHTRLKQWRAEVNALMPDLNPAYDPAGSDQRLTGAEKQTSPA